MTPRYNFIRVMRDYNPDRAEASTSGMQAFVLSGVSVHASLDPVGV